MARASDEASEEQVPVRIMNADFDNREPDWAQKGMLDERLKVRACWGGKGEKGSGFRKWG